MDSLQRGQSMVFVKKWTFFSYVFFLDKKSQKQTFFDILDRKEEKRMLFRPQKKSSKKLLKIDILVHGFCQKIDVFPHFFFLTKKSQEEIFFDILDRKECFLDLKSEVLTKSKTSKFCKGVSPWFLLKKNIFVICFFFEHGT